MKKVIECFSGIPKIIHQTAPSDKSKWPKEWFKCQQSWITLFPSPEYEYRMWSDDDIDMLIYNHFPDFYAIYTSYEFKIEKIDMARYFILYKYGGIYADMDYECLQNFYHLLPVDQVSISESCVPENEILQNALMISPAANPFFSSVIQLAVERSKTKEDNSHYIFQKNNLTRQEKIVLYQTGPVLISDVYISNPSLVNMLPRKLWNADKDDTDPNIIAKQYGTNSWKDT